MTHTLIQVVKAAVNGYCDIHGKSSKECGAAKELGGWAIGGLAIAGLIAALKS